MKFKEFMKNEDQGSDKGLMGYNIPYPRRPSNGHPFTKNLTGLSSQNTNAQASFMKKMKKK